MIVLNNCLYLTIQQYGELLLLTNSQVYTLIKNGNINSIKHKGRRYILYRVLNEIKCHNCGDN